MLHGIGKGPKVRAAEPAELLLECHGRIRAFLAMGARLASRPDAPPSERVEAVRALLRYFRVALPLHEADEEESLAPRLHAADPSGAIEEAIATITTEHARIGAILLDVDPMWQAIATDPGAPHAPRLAETTRALDAAFTAHLAFEEAQILPAIARVLALEERRTVVEEMRNRRAGREAWSEG